jgi:hypothetical protein
LLLAGCQWFGAIADQPEIPLDRPSAISPGHEYHLRGTTLTITNVEVDAAAATLHVAHGDDSGILHLDRQKAAGAHDWTGWGGYLFALEDADPEKNRAVIVVRHTNR